MSAIDRKTLARQLWFWQSSATGGIEHAETFAGQTTYSEDDWDDLLIASQQEEWLRRADRVVALVRSLEK